MKYSFKTHKLHSKLTKETMTQEDKELLFKDISARLPYEIMCDRLGQPKKLLSVSPYKVYCLEFDNGEYLPNKYKIDDIKPYLRSIPNLAEEAQTQLGRLLGAASYNILKGDYSYLKELLEYVYKNHIDLFGLIPKGLALEAPEELYKT